MKLSVLTALLFLSLCGIAVAQESVLLPNGKQQFLDANGNPLGGGSVGMYVPATLTPKTTWQDSDNSATNVNPVPLDAAGTALIYGTGEYRQIVKDALGNTIWDELTSGQLPGIAWGGTSSGTGDAQILASAGGFTATDGKQIAWRSGGTNTTAATLQVGAVGTYSIYQDSAAGPVSVIAGALATGNIYLATYDSTLGGLQLIATSVGPFTTSGGTITNSTITLKSSAAPSPTTTGTIEYDTTFDAIAVGDGSATDKYWPGVIPGTLGGCATGNNASDATNDIDFAACTTANSTATYYMAQPSAYVKQLDAGWAVGTNAGMLDTGAVANATYHLFQIMRPDTGVVDYLASLSATAPTMPANYTVFRRIASVVRLAGVNKAYYQNGNVFTWGTPVSDVAATNSGAAAVTRTLTLPTGIVVLATVVHGLFDSGSGVTQSGLLTCLCGVDVAPTVSLYDVVTVSTGATDVGDTTTKQVQTNTSAQIRSRLSGSSASNVEDVVTFGWVDTRGQ
jgi:hypothetical protein